MILIGFDCAVKSLGVCVVRYNDTYIKDIVRIKSQTIRDMEKCATMIDLCETYADGLDRINAMMDNIIKVLHLDVHDATAGANLQRCNAIAFGITDSTNNAEDGCVIYSDIVMSDNVQT